MKKRFFSIFLIVSFLFIQIWSLFVTFNYPYVGVDLKKRDNRWIVAEVYPNSNAIAKGAIQVGDEIVEVNGVEANQYVSILKMGTIEGAKTIVLLREGMEYRVEVQKRTQLSGYDYLAFAGETLCFVLAAVLYKRLSQIQSAKYLAMLFLSIGGAFMSLGASVRGDVLGKTWISTFVMLVPIVLLHFLTVFFEDKGKELIRKEIIYFAYAYVILSFLLQFMLFLPADFVHSIFKYFYFNSNAFFILGVLANITFLTSIYLKYRKESKEIRNIIKTIGVSLILSFLPLICLSFLPSILFGKIIVASFYTSIAVLFFPLSFTYLLASKKLYDIDLVIRRFLLTTVLSLVPSGMFIGVVTLLVPDLAKPSLSFVLFVVLVILLSFTLYAFEYFTTSLDRVVFPRKYRLQQALKKIAKNLGLVTSLRELKDIILLDIIETLQVFGGAIVFRYKDTKEMVVEGDIDESEVARLVDTETVDHPYYTSLEITRNEEYACYLVLAQKKSNTHLGYEETQWLNLIISYLSANLENLHLLRKLTMKLEQLAAQIPPEEAAREIAWFRKLMFELQEKERVRIAIDLHDTTMQDLFFLKRRCDAFLEEYANTISEDAAEQITGMMEYIDVINMNLRQSCFELHPYLLQEIGLVQTIEKQIELEAVAAPFEIEFRPSQAFLVESCDMEMKRQLFRIVQELLNNAKKHSQASRIKISLFATGSGSLALTYDDDGVGFDANEAVPREIGGSRTGIEYMKSRILSLNGRFELTTSRGNGMKLEAIFPIKEECTA